MSLTAERRLRKIAKICSKLRGLVGEYPRLHWDDVEEIENLATLPRSRTRQVRKNLSQIYHEKSCPSQECGCNCI